MYEEFWYVFGHVALTEGGMASAGGTKNDFERRRKSRGEDEDEDEEEDGEEEEEDGGASDAPIVRLDAELVRGAVLRFLELSPVGQPDVRAAATLAALGMAHAVLDRSAALTRKMDVAARQHAAAVAGAGGRGGGGAKAEALKARMESLRRTVEALDDLVLGPVVQGLFVHRYR